ncbi:metal-dependent hydrolase, partial [bacterium]|nr:metal-dependent hydrolase [bacterium]
MLAPTHAIYGPAIALIILSVFGIEASFHWTVVFCAIVGSLAPDLDYPRSLIGNLFPWISKPIERRYGHRTITHSILGTVVASLIFTALIGTIAWILRFILVRSVPATFSHYGFWLLNLTLFDFLRLGLAFGIGYASHLILDMITPRGIQLFWPNPSRDIILKNSLQIETASKHEIPVAILGLVLLALAFPLSQNGPMTVFRWLLATPEAVMAEFKSSTTRTDVEFEGYWTATKVPVHATAEVLTVKNKRLVIAMDPGDATPKAHPVPALRSRAGLHLQALGKAREF